MTFFCHGDLWVASPLKYHPPYAAFRKFPPLRHLQMCRIDHILVLCVPLKCDKVQELSALCGAGLSPFYYLYPGIHPSKTQALVISRLQLCLFPWR